MEQDRPARRILVADDDENIAELVRLYLAKQGYEVDLAYDGDQTLACLRRDRYDLALLDITMPGASGLQVVRWLRRHSQLPVIFLTARSSDIDKVAGLHLGADDYVTKPFNPQELLARIEAVLRRSRNPAEGAQEERLHLRGLEIDTASRAAMVDGRALVLTPKEFDLLLTLARFAGVSLDRLKLLELVWGTSYFSPRTVDVHVVKLRSKLAGAGLRIETVWGSGYRLVEEETNGTSARKPV